MESIYDFFLNVNTLLNILTILTLFVYNMISRKLLIFVLFLVDNVNAVILTAPKEHD